MADEIDALLARYRAATTTSRDDPTRREIWRRLAVHDAPPRLGRGRSVATWALAMAAALVIVWGLVDRADVPRADTPRATGDQAVDAADTGGAVRGTTQRSAPSVAEVPAVTAPKAPVAPAPVQQPTPSLAPQRPQAPAAAPSIEPAVADPLADEGVLIARAAAAMRDGQRSVARAAIDAHAKAFPRGNLAHERWVLRVELDCADGAREQAVRDARAFLAVFPDSSAARTLRDRPCDP